MAASTGLSATLSHLTVAEASRLVKNNNIEAIQQVSHTRGLSADIILLLTQKIESEELAIPIKLKLLECLIPKNTVPEDAFIKMTYLLTDSKFDLNLKVEILKWMITVLSFIDSKTIFLTLYEIFLNLFEHKTLQPYVCYLLHLITDKQQVTPRRINYVLKLASKLESQNCLTALQHLYSKLQPEIFPINLEEEFQHNFESLGVYPELIQLVHRIPLYTLSLGTFEEMYMQLQFLEETHNMQCILMSKYRRLYLTSDIPLVSHTSFFDFLVSFYSDSDPGRLSDILEVIYELQEPNAIISDFIRRFMKSWDGSSNFCSVLEIFSYQGICCFSVIHHDMNYIRELVLEVPPVNKCYCLYYISKMYQNWVLIRNEPVVQCEGNCSIFAENESLSSETDVHLYENTVYIHGSYIDLICDTLILDNQFFQSCLLNQVLKHYERISRIHMQDSMFVMHPLTSPVYFSAIFSLNSFTLECLSRLILRYNVEVRALIERNHIEAITAANYFKAFRLDLLNVWKGSYSFENKKNFLFKYLNMIRLQKKYHNRTGLFILHKHPALLWKTASFLNSSQLSPSLENLMNYMNENRLPALAKLISISYTKD